MDDKELLKLQNQQIDLQKAMLTALTTLETNSQKGLQLQGQGNRLAGASLLKGGGGIGKPSTLAGGGSGNSFGVDTDKRIDLFSLNAKTRKIVADGQIKQAKSLQSMLTKGSRDHDALGEQIKTFEDYKKSGSVAGRSDISQGDLLKAGGKGEGGFNPMKLLGLATAIDATKGLGFNADTKTGSNEEFLRQNTMEASQSLQRLVRTGTDIALTAVSMGVI